MKSIFVDISKCLSCKSCELACCVAHSKSKSLVRALAEPAVQARIFVEPYGKGAFPLQCRHCTNAQCIKACVTGALAYDENGRVRYDESKCLGCLFCVISCPFGACGELKKAAKDTVGIAKCDFCAERPEGPACTASCPTGALSFESTEDFVKDRRRSYLVNLEKEGI